MKYIVPALALIAVAVAAGCGSDSTEPEPQDCASVADTTQPATVSYGADIAPLFLSEQDGGYGCGDSDCHGGILISSDFSVSTYEDLFDQGEEARALRICSIKPGSPDDSYLFKKIRGDLDIAGERMPFEKPPVDPVDLENVRVWILEGARNN